MVELGKVDGCEVVRNVGHANTRSAIARLDIYIYIFNIFFLYFYYYFFQCQTLLIFYAI